MRIVVDQKKRISLASVLDRLNLKPGDAVDVSTDSEDRAIIILPIPPRCAVCGTQDALFAEFGEDPVRTICTECAHELTTKPLVFAPEDTKKH